MKISLAATALVLGLASGPFNGAYCAEEAARSRSSILRTWFQHFKEGLAESSVSSRYQKRRVTAVAAVRGAKQESVDPGKPHWKGGAKSKKAKQLRMEKAALAKAVDLILEGRIEEGKAGLDAFEKAHPKSSLLPEVREAREKLAELEAAAPAADAEETEAGKP